ncbi:hypothetical protein K9M59_02605 [Candidatus Gracilibacteria bacterium]|nr:hypothetical protein [Candidatus Gracilibacteria bacterium]MCF7819223.1 hypothetical protein [Candidatus Gracilibacteria bacterium]
MIKEYIRYLKDNPQGYWFKAKLYGWGWVPVTWHGWLIMLVYIGAVILFALTIDKDSSAREIAFTFILPAILLTVTLIRICYKTGEKPCWHWGMPDKYKTKK